ncbi:MAG TPA: SDR family oxidoreductase [Polyangiales bacterium]|nr:SDR family oxidoreductase [Polyangiales bacterium]
MSEPAYASIFRPGLFRGELHVITGAGSGIGRCIAHELAALEAQVVLIGRKLDKLEHVQAEIAAAGGCAHVHALDIRDEPAVQACVAQILRDHARIHGLVNNAGGQFPSPLANISKRGFEAVLATNLTGGFLMAREVFKGSMQQHGGAIVNMVADMWNGMPGMGHSGAARAGMVNLTKTAAFEWATQRIRVNAVAPGYIASSGLDQYPEAMRQLILGLKDHVPLGRIGLEAEVSAAVCFLLSPAAAFITGITLPVDGGAPLGNEIARQPASPPSAAFEGFLLARPPAVLDEDE